MQNILTFKNFYKEYKELRTEFVDNFKDTKTTHPKRFVWDFWYDEDQYHLIRTPAYHYFSAKKYQAFHSFLVQWGRENLGCHDISPPWLSYYVDGCYQKLHSDVPHGPWAFVYSLTPNKKKFIGGETLVLKSETLNFWQNFKQNGHYEFSNFVDVVPSLMNQLVVFDPRFPHAVSEVKGTRDPLESRLVMHGWFVNPRPYVVGGLSTALVQKALDKSFLNLNDSLKDVGLLDGTVSIRLKVSKAGDVMSYKVLTHTLVSIANNAGEVRRFEKKLKNIFGKSKFNSSIAESNITIPLIFK